MQNFKDIQYRDQRVSQSGFTLVEVCIAGLILVLVTAGMFATCITAIRTQDMAARHYRATGLARSRIQRASSLPYSSLPLLTETRRYIDDAGNNATTGRYQRATTITQVSTSCYQVVVQIYYESKPGVMLSTPVELRTMIAENMFDGGF